MWVELVQTRADGIRLDGALAPTSAPAQLGVDAVLCLHGTGSNFYGSSLFASLTPAWLAAGAAVLTVNTRGHDLAYPIGAGRYQGAAFESFADSPRDIEAWLGFLDKRGLRRVALVGHSAGAIKTIYALSRSRPTQVACAIAISPPRLSHAYFSKHDASGGFMADFRRASEKVAAGHGDTVLDVRFPLPHLVTAAGFLDKYGPEERYDFLSFVSQVTCPLLITFGGAELLENIAFRGLPEALAETKVQAPRFDVDAIDDADHNYTTRRNELSAAIGSWLASLARAGGLAAW